MAEGTPSGWLPPTAPGAGPRPRFDPAPEHVPEHPPEPAAARPTFVRPAPAAPGERNRAAGWGLTLGITGLVLLVISFGSLFMIALPCSVAAWVLARRARTELDQGTTGQGEGQASAALWLGRIGVIAGVAAAVVFIALIASGFDFDQFRDDLQRELDRRRQEQNGGDAGNVRTSIEHLRTALAAWPAR
jgi:hypothetical protein